MIDSDVHCLVNNVVSSCKLLFTNPNRKSRRIYFSHALVESVKKVMNDEQLYKSFYDLLMENNIKWQRSKHNIYTGVAFDLIKIENEKNKSKLTKLTDHEIDLINALCDTFSSNDVPINFNYFNRLSTKHKILKTINELDLYDVLEKIIIVKRLEE